MVPRWFDRCRILLAFAWLTGLTNAIWANPPYVIPVEPDYGGDYDLFGGQNYLTSDDGLISLTATHGMSLMKRVEQAKERLQALLNPLEWNHLKAPVEMQKQLFLALAWMAEAD
ncbi:hypothetical protein EBX31_13660, partial [bacterium]|nr:hypothetical protein [bacterium]